MGPLSARAEGRTCAMRAFPMGQGEIVNMQSNDTQRIMDLCPNFHLLWSAPLQVISTHDPSRAVHARVASH